jgi:hypothetical protein
VSEGTGVRFCTGEAITDVGSDELVALQVEPERIVAANPPRPDADALIEKLRVFDGPFTPERRTFEPDPEEAGLLLRATDHLRNLRHRGELIRLRQHLYARRESIPYRLRFRDGRSTDFWGYSLPYQRGDRLVTLSGEALVVLRAEEDGEQPSGFTSRRRRSFSGPRTLDVEAWSDRPASLGSRVM